MTTSLVQREWCIMSERKNVRDQETGSRKKTRPADGASPVGPEFAAQVDSVLTAYRDLWEALADADA